MSDGAMWSILHGDCLDLLRDVAPGSIDLVLADPPYSSGGFTRGDRMLATGTKYLTRGAGRVRNADFAGDNRDQRAWSHWMALWLGLALRVARPEGGDVSERTRDEIAKGPMEDEIRAVCAEIADLLVEKNRAYGNSALDPLRVFSKASAEEQILVRLDDKLSRLKRGSAAGEDVVLDLMGYLVLLRVSRRTGGASASTGPADDATE